MVRRALGPLLLPWLCLGCSSVFNRWDKATVDARSPHNAAEATVESTSGEESPGEEPRTDTTTPSGDARGTTGGTTSGGTTGASPNSPAPTLDVDPPSALQGLTVVAGHTAVGATIGTNKLIIDFPNSAGALADYATVTVRRKRNAVPTDCADGIVAKKYTSPTFPDPDTFWDDTGEAGAVFGYLVCIEDRAGNTTSSDSAAGVQSKEHILFATAQGYPGDLSGMPAGGGTGLARADFICAQAATGGLATVSSETRWRAVLSDSNHAARNRVVVIGKVGAPGQLSTYADEMAEFWGGTLQNPVDTEVGGIPAADFALSGTNGSGLRVMTADFCNNWTVKAAGTAWVGDLNDVTAWLDKQSVACDDHANEYSIYCLSQPPVAPTIATFAASTGSGGTGHIDLRLVPPADVTRYSEVDLYRKGGPAAPNAECDGTDGNFIQSFSPVTGEINFDDPTAGGGGGIYSYRACVFDAFGNVITTAAATGVSS